MIIAIMSFYIILFVLLYLLLGTYCNAIKAKIVKLTNAYITFLVVIFIILYDVIDFRTSDINKWPILQHNHI